MMSNLTSLVLLELGSGYMDLTLNNESRRAVFNHTPHKCFYYLWKLEYEYFKPSLII